MKLEVGKTYRAKRPRPINAMPDRLVNDRIILHLTSSTVQYDGPGVPNGRHFPTVSKEDFLDWASDEIVEDSDWWTIWPIKKEKK